MREMYIKKILEKMKEKDVDLMVASAMVFDEEREKPDFVKDAFDEAEEKFKEYAPEIIKEDAENGLADFDLDKFIEGLKEEKENRA